ncbi:MAG: transposase, partial [Gemmatimonadota bacterium]
MRLDLFDEGQAACLLKWPTRPDKSERPTAGNETVDALAFLARAFTHLSDRGQVTTRYYGWYAAR